MDTAYFCRRATEPDLIQLWDWNISVNPGDQRWTAWKQQSIQDNRDGRALTFAVICGGVPVGEGTLLVSPACGAIGGRTELADGVAIANVNALRIRKAYEGRGYISALMRCIEAFAAQRGYQRLTIGVEERETRNLAIYLHWGYTQFVTSAVEDGTLVLYYAKDLFS